MNNKKTIKKVYGPTLLAHTLRQFFQCGDLKDVSDFVAVSAHRTAVKTKRTDQPLGSTDDEKGYRQPDMVLSNSTSTSHSHSSSSSFVMPSRKSMEELIRKNKARPTPRSRSLLYCGAFDCATKDTTSTTMDDPTTTAAERDLDASSIFSRTAASTPNGASKQDGDAPYHSPRNEAAPPSLSSSSEAASGPRTPRSQFTYRMNQSCELRSVGSDCISTSTRSVSTVPTATLA